MPQPVSDLQTLLNQAQQQNLLRPLDVQFAALLNEHPALQLAAALISRNSGEGHVCLPLARLTPAHCFAGQHLPLAQALFQAAGNPASWRDTLLATAAVSEDHRATPLKLFRERLYLHRLWHNERSVAQFFNQQNHPIELDESRLSALLNQLFPAPAQHSPTARPAIDWQKVAVAVALTRRIAIISGGPGSGKTTTVARLLAALLALTAQASVRVKLAAPTGKAAARLTESLALALSRLELAPSRLPDPACTLHRLLGLRPGSVHPRHHAQNPLHLDVLIVDEASMIDLPMMARLIHALPAHARLILLGDHDQLASVEAGAVLGDLCQHAKTGYSPPRAAQLARLTGYPLTSPQPAPAAGLRDSLCLLRKSYRFQADSGIGQLASAVNQGDSAALHRLLQQDFQDIKQHPLDSEQHYQAMLTNACQGYQPYLHQLEQLTPDSDPRQLLQAFSRYQLLCALRNGPFGVSGLNERLERELESQRLIRRTEGQRWYHGRPIMISRNDSALGLFNGDLGITLAWQNALRVWFPLADGSLKSFSPARLPAHETAWAMTVHKSQGSEFDQVALILPDQRTPVVTRELVYTAITRARHQLTLYASESALRQAIDCRVARFSGLLEENATA